MEGYIYKITSPNTNKIYIGSTTLTLLERLNTHKYHIERQNISSKEILKAGDAKIELIESIVFEDKKEAAN